MKKTIAAVALTVSGAANAFPIFDPNAKPPVLKTYCLDIARVYGDRSIAAGSCDQFSNNIADKKKLKESGCADKQVAIRTYADLSISSCMPTGAVQL